MIKMSIKKRNVLEFNQNFVDNMTVLSSRLWNGMSFRFYFK
jgi:hypothetical protein